jgi:riboflavin transporter FmnP
MHVIATGAMALTAGFIFKYKKGMSGLVISLLAGACAMILVMIPANLILTPIFYGQPKEAVKQLLLPAIIPFNAIKSLLNGAVVLIIYQRIGGYLRKD